MRSQFSNLECDWALENNVTEQPFCPAGCQIVSLHRRSQSESIGHCLAKIERNAPSGSQLKLAIEIRSFDEIAECLAWQSADSTRRSFLPRSPAGSKVGRWTWVRCYLKGRQKIHFLKMMDGSSIDQPTPFQWLATPDRPKKFAAVLGSPIFHSWSPEMHRSFFAHQQIPFWAIELTESEWAEALPMLQKMGLVAAAITSPLKTVAGSINTMWLKATEWSRANTDGDGLESLVDLVRSQNISDPKICIWGGGGTLSVLKSKWPQAHYFSVRSGKEREPAGEPSAKPEVVIWAASPEAALPPSSWKPRLVLDLNYREDSRAKEFALNCQAKYVSGEEMFRIQALKQQNLWSDL